MYIYILCVSHEQHSMRKSAVQPNLVIVSKAAETEENFMAFVLTFQSAVLLPGAERQKMKYFGSRAAWHNSWLT